MARNRNLLEVQNSSASLVVGLVFIANSLFHGNLYDRFPDTYRFMAFWPSWKWGIVYATFGVIHMLTLYFHKRTLRKSILLIKAGAWIFLGICVVYGDVFASSGWLYFIFATFAAISFLKTPKYEDSHYDISVPPNAPSLI